MNKTQVPRALQPAPRPEAAGVPSATVRAMEHRVEVAIERGVTQGAVLLAARKGRIVEFRAFGEKGGNPGHSMTRNTVFDLASLSKIVGTATATLLLIEDGVLGLDDPAARFLPAFALEGKGDVTIGDLLTHRSGLKAYESLAKVKGEVFSPFPDENLIEHIARLPTQYPRGDYTIYSCLNYLALARVNELAAGESQESLLRRRIWEPLGMTDTGYTLSDEQKARLAPTRRGEAWTPGIIHDPLANYHGTSTDHCPGNAGLFSTARDLATFCQMILNEGEHAGVRVLRPETVRMMTSLHSSLPEYDPEKKGPGAVERRGLGWIVYGEGPFVSPKAPDGSFIGHTGYTGTYLWIDRHQKAFVILLANAVYSQDPPQIHDCRRQVTAAWIEGTYESP